MDEDTTVADGATAPVEATVPADETTEEKVEETPADETGATIPTDQV